MSKTPTPAPSRGGAAPRGALRRLFPGRPALRDQAASYSMFAVTRKPAATSASGADDILFEQLHADLAASLGAVAETRKLLRHLGHFEKALFRYKSKALAGIPLPVLRRIHAELLVLLSVAPISVGLVELDRRLRERLVLRWPRDLSGSGAVTRFDADSAVQVSDSTLDDYDQAVIESGLAPLAQATPEKGRSTGGS